VIDAPAQRATPTPRSGGDRTPLPFWQVILAAAVLAAAILTVSIWHVKLTACRFGRLPE